MSAAARPVAAGNGRAAILRRWLAHQGPAHPDADGRVLAAILGRCLADAERPLDAVTGLGADDFDALLARFFPRARIGWAPGACLRIHAFWASGLGMPPAPAPRKGDLEDLLAEEAADVRELLWRHRADDDPVHDWFATLTARACLGADHLWQDLGLDGRGDLSAFLGRHFPSLHARNTGNMKWKKFFYKTLCDESGLNLCRAPNCRECDDYAVCFAEAE